MSDNDSDMAKREQPNEAEHSAGGGEDESSTSHEGKDDHLHEDQKPTKK